MDNNVNNIPIEKFRFASRDDLYHDQKFETKPVSYFQGAFQRFSKNKGAVVGAVVISILVLFAIIAPFFTPFQPAYYDMVYAHVTPKSNLFANSGIDFWDGCRQKDTNYIGYLKDKALAAETGREIIKNGEYVVTEDGSGYSYRYDTYYGVGFGKYKIISAEEFEDIQRYQDETGRQVLYPVVKYADRPTLEKNKYDANIYYKVENPNASILRPKLDSKGNIIPNYWKYEAGDSNTLIPEYNSLRIEGENGIQENGKQYFYAYGRRVDGGIEVRAEYYEYYIYRHNEVLKDGITEPLFLFGTTQTGKDIFACLAYGARFSFMFATIVALANFIFGVIWGSISGYCGGKIDLFMERFSEILGSVPTMIVITLLKYHMGTSSQALVLFIAFFATGWIGMAGRTRMQFYRFKNQEYVLAARTLGARDTRIMFKHIFPNGLGTIVTSVALVIPSMIYSETSLSYLGIINLEAGNTTSVGTLIAAGQKSIMANAGYVAFFPCMFLVLLMLSFNLFGNGLRDAFNPSLRGTED
ncbi:MAG: ABC transporter permease [Oscillospiraceae bacterium]|nr:ABC transporter permease [Oscillospiraceae bacterium]